MLLHFYLELLQSSSGICSALATYRKCSKHVTPKTTNATKISWWILPLSHQRILTISMVLLLLTVCINYYYSLGFVDFHLHFFKIILSFLNLPKNRKQTQFYLHLLVNKTAEEFLQGWQHSIPTMQFSKYGVNSIKIYKQSLSKRSQFRIINMSKNVFSILASVIEFHRIC